MKLEKLKPEILLEVLFKIFKTGNRDLLIFLGNELIPIAMDSGFTTVNQLVHLLAQLGHETAGFRTLMEYGKKSYFRKYDGRKDLGNTQAGDGAKYKGRGFIMITGRYNYKKYGDRLEIDLKENPELAAMPHIAILIALLYWKDKDLNKLADKGDYVAITRRINGGLNGLADRRKYLFELNGAICKALGVKSLEE